MPKERGKNSIKKKKKKKKKKKNKKKKKKKNVDEYYHQLNIILTRDIVIYALAVINSAYKQGRTINC